MNEIKKKVLLENFRRKVRRGTRLADDVRQDTVKASDSIQETVDDPHTSSSEYAADKLEHGIETVTMEAGHLVVDTAKLTFRAGEKVVQGVRNRKQAKAQGTSDPQPNPSQEHPVPQLTAPSPATGSSNLTPAPQPQPAASSAVTGSRIAAPKPTETTVEASGKASIKAADRSVKTAQRSIKTAGQSSKHAVKTAEKGTRAAEKVAETTAKAVVKARRIAEAAAIITAQGLKAVAEATAKAVKAISAGISKLVAAIAAGGWVSVAIIVVIMLTALLLGSTFGIFFSSEDSGSGMTMQNVVLEINRDYNEKIDAIKNTVDHDELETSGSQVNWKEALAVYAVMLNADPANPQEVVTMDDAKKAILEGIFWDMNDIDYRTSARTETTLMEIPDEDGNLVVTEVPVTIKTLHIVTSCRTTEEMAAEYAFSEEQKEWLAELLKPEYDSLWAGVLYGIHNADGQIVAVALSQVGNVGGRPYWSWYGFNERVAWCACFVSWCADQCGYIEAGIIPKFAGCGYGADWFIQRGQWADRNYVPQPGDIIFFDWVSNGQDGSRDHVGLVEKCENGYVYTVEGNITDSCVQRRYPVGWYEIVGYGLPAY